MRNSKIMVKEKGSQTVEFTCTSALHIRKFCLELREVLEFKHDRWTGKLFIQTLYRFIV
jgi:hypothetical protein